MKQRVTARRIWGIIYPILIYIAASYLVIMLVEAILLAMLTISENGNGNNLADVVSSYLSDQTVLLTLCIALVTIPFMIYFMYRDRENDKMNNRLISYDRVAIPKYLLIVVFGVFGMLMANYLVNIFALYMPQSMISSYGEVSEAVYGSGMWAQVLAAGIVCPIMEELLFRGVIYNRIKKMTPIWAAALISALLFGIYHGNVIQGIYGFIVGLLCVYIYERYKTIVAPCIFHMTANLFALFINARMESDTYTYTYTSYDRSTLFTTYLSMFVAMGILTLVTVLIINRLVKPREAKK